MEDFHALAWVTGTAVLCVSDFLWFRFFGDRIYHFSTLLNQKPPLAAVSVFACAVFASAVLTVFRGKSVEDAAAAGALIGGLVFFVFNACAYYILNNLKENVLLDKSNSKSTLWSAPTALSDTLYGTGLYSATAVVIWEVAAAQ